MLVEAIATGSASSAIYRDHWVQIAIVGVKERRQQGGDPVKFS
jgi:hypothetical protein